MQSGLDKRKIKSVALCSSMSKTELKTISDVQKFAEINGETVETFQVYSTVTVKYYVFAFQYKFVRR